MKADWYFDFISPFAYLQWQWLRDQGVVLVEPRPVLLAGLLTHHGHKGPAEIPSKREFTYRHVQWKADRAGIALRFPPAHPFNPLPALRLCMHAGCTGEAIDAIFRHLWVEGHRGDDAASLAPVAEALGLDVDAALADPQAKADLQRNYAQAVERGVFGVPTLLLDGMLFWGDDATPMLLHHLEDPAFFRSERYAQLAQWPVGITRQV